MLCVLAGPSLLRIFDVYPQGASNSSSSSSTGGKDHDANGDQDDDDDDDDDVAGAGGGEGHSVPLPFECGGIYAVPNGGGLLLQRAETAEESAEESADNAGEEMRRLVYGQQQHLMHDDRGDNNIDNTSGIGNVGFRIRRQPSQEESSQEGSQEGSVELRRPPRAVRIEGSREVIMGDVGKAMELSDAAATAGDAATASSMGGDAGADGGVVIDTAPYKPSGFGVGTAIGGGGVPSLFSLSHPLDDVRLVALGVPTASAAATPTRTPKPTTAAAAAVPDLEDLSESQKDNGCNADGALYVATDQLQQTSESSDLGILGPFSDVNERLMYAGRPRCFGASSSSLPSSVVVTYHTRRCRHAVWVVGSAPPPPDVLPLWKRTAASRRRVDGMGGPAVRRIDAAVLDEVDDAAGLLLSKGTSTTEDGWVLLDDGASPTRGRRATSPRQAFPPAFGELHPTMTLSLLFEEEVAVMEEEYGGRVVGDDSYCFAGSRFFLSTDSVGQGDSILCWVQRNRNGYQNGNGRVLRRLVLAPRSGHEDKHTQTRPFLLADTMCIDAVPLLSSPVPEPAYNSNSGGRCGFKLCCSPRSVDVLVYAADAGSSSFPSSSSTSIALYRGGIEISYCSLANLVGQDKFSLVGLSDPVCDRLTLRFEVASVDSSPLHPTKILHIRASLDLVLTSPVAESTLGAVEANLVFPALRASGAIEAEIMAGLAIAVRADCVRYARCVIRLDDKSSTSASDDIEWFAVTMILSAIFDELIRMSTQDNNRWNGRGSGCLDDTMAQTQGTSDWDALLASDFHSQYFRDCSHILPLERPAGGSAHKVHLGCPPSLKEVNNIIPSSSFWLDRIASSTQSVPDSSTANDAVNQSYQKQTMFAMARLLFDSLHLFYEDCKLCRNSRGKSWTILLGEFLHTLCHKVFSTGCMEDFVDHYNRDGVVGTGVLDSSIATPIVVVPRIRISSYDRPPNLFAWVDATVRGDEDFKYPPYSRIDDSTDRFFSSVALTPPASCTLCRLLSILYARDTATGREKTKEYVVGASLDRQTIDRKLVLTMISQGISDPLVLRNELPTGVALPFMEALRRCRTNPPPPCDCSKKNGDVYFSSDAYELIGRSDLARMQLQRDAASNVKRNSSGKKGVEEMAVGLARTTRTQTGATFDPDHDGLSTLALSTSMLYPHDTRIHEVGRLLRSSRPSYLRVPRAVEVSDHDYERLKQEKLRLLCRRKLALPVGRGMATFCTMESSAGPMQRTSAVPAEPIQVPKLAMAGRVPPTNATLAFDVSECPSDMTVWPDFHNGVAAGLRLPKAGDMGSGQITRTWIVYNRPPPSASPTPPPGTHGNNHPPVKDHSHAGLLFALGLQGHLSSLSMTDVYDYLTQGTVTTSVGVLLGMSACKKGTCDQSVSKMLCLHIPSLLPPSFATMEVAPPARTAAVSGIGLLYMGSGHRLMTEFLLGEIGRRPRSDGIAIGRESYALSCGLALGLVNLSKGGDSESGGGNVGLSDLRLEERLHRYVVGGPEDPETKSKREAADRAAAGIGAGGAAGPSPDQEKCSCIYEGENINTDVTAPGATLCLGLMYLKTRNKSVSSRLALPDTHFLLDCVRPDLLLLRVVARSMILWDDIEPTSLWIEDQIPVIIRRSFDRMVKKAENTAGFAGLASFAALHMQTSQDHPPSRTANTSGGSNAVDFIDAEMQGRAKSVSEDEAKSGDLPPPGDGETEEDVDVDRQAIRQAHAHIVAGACFGMGLRYAGSGNEQAASAIMERVEHFIRLRDESDAISVALRPERPILEMCLCCAAVSLAIVMAGTGDVHVLKLLRAIRWRCDEAVRYGTHMAIGSAIGLLFLGGGTCTLGNEPEDIAALVMAFFPRFPRSTSDNQYHLQALRHCYALAVKRRLLHAIDIDTKENVFVPLEIVLNGKVEVPLRLTTPCLLLNKGNYSQVRVVSDRYYPASFDLHLSNSSDSHLALFVKKKSGHLSFLQDPQSQRSLLVQTGGSGGGSAIELIRAFTEDQKLLAYAKYLCDESRKGVRNHGTMMSSKNKGKPTGGGLGSSTEEFCTEILHECLTKEKTEAIRMYLGLRHAIISTENGAFSVDSMWDVRIVRSYYEGIEHICASPAPRSLLLSFDFVASVCENLDAYFERKGCTGATLISYFESRVQWESLSKDERKLMGCFLVYNDVPYPNTSSL